MPRGYYLVGVSSSCEYFGNKLESVVAAAIMEPDGRKIYGALLGLLEQLSDRQIQRAFWAAEFPSSPGHLPQANLKDDVLNAIRVEWDKEQQRGERKARTSLMFIAEQLVKDVGEERVQEALRDRGIALVDNEFVPLENAVDDLGEHGEAASKDIRLSPDAGQLNLSTSAPVASVTGVGASVLPSITQAGGDRKLKSSSVLSPVTQQGIGGGGASAVIVDPRRPFGPDAVLVSRVQEQHDHSRLSLGELKEALDGLRGHDVPETSANSNKAAVPLSQVYLDHLSAVIQSAIDLHESPVITREIKGWLQGISDALDGFNEWIKEAEKVAEKAGTTFKNLRSLSLKVIGASLALVGLIEVVTRAIS